jgi:hypothetical protein
VPSLAIAHLGIPQCSPEVVEQIRHIVVDEGRCRPSQFAKNEYGSISPRFDPFAYMRGCVSNFFKHCGELPGRESRVRTHLATTRCRI